MESTRRTPCCFDGKTKLKNVYEDILIFKAPVLSDEDVKIFEYVDYVFICGLVGWFGIAANIINIVIFYKHGFTSTVNIAFFALSVSDLFCLVTLEWTSISINPSLPVYYVTWVSIDVMYLTAAWPHVCFSRINSYITVYITAERFISIAWPLKIKQIVTAKRTTLIICIIYIINISALVPEYATSYLDWKFVHRKNLTLIGIHFTSNRHGADGLIYFLHALLSTTSFLAIIIFTFALVLKLRKSSNWRKEATLDEWNRESKSDKERKTVKMVVLIATVLIVCCIPGSIISLATFIVGEELNVGGPNINIEQAVWSIAYCFQSVNSSVNIFLYYKMSTKYRHTFNDIFFKRFSGSK